QVRAAPALGDDVGEERVSLALDDGQADAVDGDAAPHGEASGERRPDGQVAGPPLHDLPLLDDPGEHTRLLRRLRGRAAGPLVPAADLLEAVLAVDGAALGGQERDLGRGAADGAGDLVHRAGAGDAAAFATEGAALGAAAWLVHQSLRLVE